MWVRLQSVPCYVGKGSSNETFPRCSPSCTLWAWSWTPGCGVFQRPSFYWGAVRTGVSFLSKVCTFVHLNLTLPFLSSFCAYTSEKYSHCQARRKVFRISSFGTVMDGLTGSGWFLNPLSFMLVVDPTPLYCSLRDLPQWSYHVKLFLVLPPRQPIHGVSPFIGSALFS